MPSAARVLVADDDPHILRALTRLLGRHALVSCAASADDVVALVRKGDRFDMILFDLSLAPPTEIMQRLAAIDPDQARRIVVHTGDVGFRNSVSGRSGAPPLLVKPASLAELSAMLVRVIDEHGRAIRNAA